jgi:hypothetical protein
MAQLLDRSPEDQQETKRILTLEKKQRRSKRKLNLSQPLKRTRSPEDDDP